MEHLGDMRAAPTAFVSSPGSLLLSGGQIADPVDSSSKF